MQMFACAFVCTYIIRMSQCGTLLLHYATQLATMNMPLPPNHNELQYVVHRGMHPRMRAASYENPVYIDQPYQPPPSVDDAYHQN